MLVLSRARNGPPVYVTHRESGDTLKLWLTGTKPKTDAKVEAVGPGFTFATDDAPEVKKVAWIRRGTCDFVATHAATGQRVVVCVTADGTQEAGCRLGFEADKSIFEIKREELLTQENSRR